MHFIDFSLENQWVHLPSKSCQMSPYWIGIGYQQRCSRQMIASAIQSTCQQHQVAMTAIAGLATISTKANDPKLLDLCGDRRWQLQSFPAEVLKPVAIPSPSRLVLEKTGSSSVCEAAAILACVSAAHHNKWLEGGSAPQPLFDQPLFDQPLFDQPLFDQRADRIDELMQRIQQVQLRVPKQIIRFNEPTGNVAIAIAQLQHFSD
jgi:Cobalamin synthesis G C-terminus